MPRTARTMPRAPGSRAGFGEAAGVARVVEALFRHPFRHLMMVREPDVLLAAEIFEDLPEHRGHRRPSAEMAVHAQVNQRAGLAGVQIVEHLLVDLEIDLRAR